MAILYLDNSVVRLCTDGPEGNALLNQWLETIGRPFKFVKSYYLFLEYLGFTKERLGIPDELKRPRFDHHSRLARIDPRKGVSDEEAVLLGECLGIHEHRIGSYIYERLQLMYSDFEALIEERNKKIPPSTAAQELVSSLFGSMLWLIDHAYSEFVKQATLYLTWDVFCGIHPIGLPLGAIRERQLGFWLQRWERGEKLPFGKIIDDQSHYYKMGFSARFDGKADMVDAEMHTYLIMGHEMHPVHCVTYFPAKAEALSERNELALGIVENIKQSLGRDLVRVPGKMYCLGASNCIEEILVPMFRDSPYPQHHQQSGESVKH